jgi:hypothetical protein
VRTIAALALAWLCLPAAAQHHYVFVNRDHEKIMDAAFLRTSALEGAQVKYTWRELEPRPDAYDFDPIRRDLAFLQSKGKKLWVQLQDVSFDAAIVNVPPYLKDDRRYGGGVARQKPDGWVALRWNTAVRERFQKLLAALGREFDGRIEGINLPETSIDLRGRPAGFTEAGYRDAVIANMTALERAFPTSVAMQYANFMPGEWLPDSDKGYLRSVYRAARELGAAVGGPDLLPRRRGQLLHAYPLIRESAGIVPTGIAVQAGNYDDITVGELHRFARERLRVDYIFWGAEEPYYSRDVVPYLAALPRR